MEEAGLGGREGAATDGQDLARRLYRRRGPARARPAGIGRVGGDLADGGLAWPPIGQVNGQLDRTGRGATLIDTLGEKLGIEGVAELIEIIAGLDAPAVGLRRQDGEQVRHGFVGADLRAGVDEEE